MADLIPFPSVRPRSFQKRGCDMIVNNGATFLMWDMGAGKTLTCILAMKKLGIPVLVMAPLNAAAITWPDELDKWAPELTYTVLHGKNKKHLASRAHTFDVTILNYEGLPWFYNMVQQKVFKLRKFFVIWDESSMLKDRTTKRWEIMNDAYPIFSPYRVNLSGTPMPNTMVDLWSQFYLLDAGQRLSTDFFQFRNKYFNYSGAPKYTTTLKMGAEDRIYERIADITDRLGPEDHIELPDVVHNDIQLELPKSLRKMYEELELEFMLEFADGDAVANSAAVLGSKLRQFNQGALYLEHDIGVPHGTPKKYNVIHDLKAQAVKNLMATSSSPILAPIQFRFERDMIEKALKRSVPFIGGSTSALEAKRLVKEWNEGKIPLLLCHPRSVAFSLNLQFGGHTVLWVALPWEMDLYEQLTRRLRRRGQLNTVIVHRLMFKNTIDIKIARALAIKNANQEKLFNAMIERRK